MNMLMPYSDTRPDTLSSSSPHRHDSGAAEVWKPDSDFEQLKLQLSSAIAVSQLIDSPLRGLLTELAIDRIDPSVPTIPDKIRTPNGELPTLSVIGTIETLASRRAESPHTPNEWAKGEAFKPHNKEPASDILNYFHLLERTTDPQTPYQVIRLTQTRSRR